MLKRKAQIFHDSTIKKKEFNPGEEVLVYNSRLRLFSGKLRSKWLCPFVVYSSKWNGTTELLREDGSTFRVNGHLLKHYLRPPHDPNWDVKKKVTVPNAMSFYKVSSS